MPRTETREDIIKVGSELIARGGFGQTGIDKILKKAKVPKGSFYYYFSSKEDFGLAVIDRFGSSMLEHVRVALGDEKRPPLKRLRAFFESGLARIGSNECKRGCLIGDLGQELAHQNETFRKRLEEVFDAWKAEIAACLKKARQAGELAKTADPGQLADFILSGWEGAILRAKVKHSVEPLEQFIEVLFSRVLTA
jgi:TetR/AcrR family transcriptional regulator, transcriptional repressor for nem operon